MFRDLFRYLGCLSILFLLWCSFSSPVHAVLREHHEKEGIIRYHSHYTVQDSTRHTWQVLLFPVDGNFHLRLVGYPDVVHFKHPDALELLTSNGDVLVARDVFKFPDSVSNTGEYDISPLLPKLPDTGRVKLILPLKENDRSLNIPDSIVLEWHWLARYNL